MADDVRPDPDPTRLTTDQLRREIISLRELLEAKLDAEISLTAQKFQGVQVQFSENRLAVNAAFQASEKAGAKSEQLMQQGLNANSSQIDDLKSRVGLVEGRREGSGQSTDRTFQIIAALAVLIAVIEFVAPLIGHR